MLANFDGRGCLGKVLVRLHARLPGALCWDWCLDTVDARKKRSGCSCQEVLGKSSSNNTTAHHHVEVIVVSMGRLKKSVPNTRVEI